MDAVFDHRYRGRRHNSNSIMRGRTLNRKRNAAPSKLIAQRLDAARSIESAIPDEWLVRKPNLDTSIIRAIVLIYGLSQQMENEFRDLARSRFSLRVGDLRILFALRRSGESGGLRPTELFRSLLITSSAVTKQVDRLITRGLVKRCPDPDTRKSFRVRLTPAGRRTADAAIQEIMESFALAGAMKELPADLAATGLEFLLALSAGVATSRRQPLKTISAGRFWQKSRTKPRRDALQPFHGRRG
jgi:DNA-binding MarR family transcriptional regulator